MRARISLIGLAVVCIAALATAACVDGRTYLKNEKTGVVVQCGSKHPHSFTESAEQQREAQCIQDYKEQGFGRVPGAK